MTIRKADPLFSSKFFPKNKKEKIDTVRSKDVFTKNHNVLWDALNAWTALEEFRRKARRNKMYTFGNQWGDKILNPDGCGYITEEQHIKNQGNVPMKNNRIRGIVRSVLGVFSSTQTEPVCVSRDRDKQSKGEMMSATLQYVYQLNKLWELDRRNLEYFLITGFAAFKSTFGWRDDKNDVWTDLVNYNRVFFDPHMEDPRHTDCHLIGEIHDVGLYDVMAKFADGSKEKALRIRQIYSYCDKENTISYMQSLTEDTHENRSFFIPDDETRCRVIEIWKKESKERLLVHDWETGDFYKAELEEEVQLIRENEKRIREQSQHGIAPEDMKLIKYQWFIDNYWYFYYMSPQGDVLKEGETPFYHKSHPYSFKIYPFYDGQVFPFVSDFIDQQRIINRMVMMQDFIMRASAKGVLMFPEDAKPNNMTMEEIAEEWATYNGVIYYKPKQGIEAPKQIIANTSQTGAYDMLQLQLKLLEDISGIQGALQGQQPKSGTPAALYMQQTQNSATSLTDLFESYKSLREERDMKNLKLIQQSYTDIKYININSNGSINETIYRPDQVKNAEFDLSIAESTSTPAYRMVMNDFLMQMFSMGQVTLEELLENGTFPFADKLLQSIKARKEEAMVAQQAMMNGQMQGGQMQNIVPADVQQQIDMGANQQISALLYNQNAA